MKIGAKVLSSQNSHKVVLISGNHSREITIPPKNSGFGSSVSGGEALFMAVATCYCNDIYREATLRSLAVERVEVEVEGDFPAEGAPAENVTYRASVKANADPDAIRDLMRHTDSVAEIHNTLRAATPVKLIDVLVIDG
jgi:uncharacterized OsmC-like protein